MKKNYIRHFLNRTILWRSVPIIGKWPVWTALEIRAGGLKSGNLMLNRYHKMLRVNPFLIKIWTSILFLLIISNLVYSQEKVRGLSAPGSIGKTRRSSRIISTGSDMVCTISFQDSSGDDVLSIDERATITIFVRNYNELKSIQPKLEIQLRSDRGQRPELKIISLHAIPPGQSETFTDRIRWSEDLLQGWLTYSVRVFDSASGFRSKTAQIQFEVQARALENQSILLQ